MILSSGLNGESSFSPIVFIAIFTSSFSETPEDLFCFSRKNFPASVSDFNGDMYPDIYISNDFYERDYLYINQRNGTFKDIAVEAGTPHAFVSLGPDVLVMVCIHAAEKMSATWLDGR